MWCDLGESVGSRACDIFSFLFDWSPHLGEVHFAENPTWIGPVVPMLKQLKDSQNKKKCIPYSSCILQSINAPNFRLIPLDRSQHIYTFVYLLDEAARLQNNLSEYSPKFKLHRLLQQKSINWYKSPVQMLMLHGLWSSVSLYWILSINAIRFPSYTAKKKLFLQNDKAMKSFYFVFLSPYINIY